MTIYSTLAKQIKREIKNKRQAEKELGEIFEKNTTQPNSQDQARNQLEKEIKELRERIKILVLIGGGSSGMVEKQRMLYQKKIQEWLSKYGEENKTQITQISREEVTQEL